MTDTDIPCQFDGCHRMRVGMGHLYCVEHDPLDWALGCILCQRTDGEPHDALLIEPEDQPVG